MKFTIITVAYNEERGITETVRSVLKQDYRDFEYLIIDGNSSDKTVEIVTNLIKKSDKDVKLFSEPDLGIYNAMNKGIQKASGDFVIFINAGDQLYDRFVLKKLSRFINQKGNRIYYGKIYRVHCSRGIDRVKDFSKVLYTWEFYIHYGEWIMSLPRAFGYEFLSCYVYFSLVT